MERRREDPIDWTASTLAARIRAKKISAVEYATVLLDHCKAHADLNGYIHQNPDALLAEARAADDKLAKDAKSCGPLHGVPIALKDNINTIDAPTTGGTPALKGRVPKTNAPSWQCLRDAGALLAGKANMHELAFGGTNDNLAYGRAQNPFDPARTPGGSSGGSGVVVAARLAPAALGSDTGGSVRVPAGLCGVTGFRPTLGRYSTVGVVPLSRSRDTLGPMAHSVEDIALLDGLMANDAAPLHPVLPRSIMIGVDRARFFEKVHADVLAVLDAAMAQLTRAGITFVDIKADPDAEAVKDGSATVMGNELVADIRAYLAEFAPGLTMEEVHAQAASPALKARWAVRLAETPGTNAAAYNAFINEQLPALQRRHNAIFSENNLDAFIAPATPETALPFAGDDTVLRNGAAVSSWFYFDNTNFAPVRGNPSIALPAGLSGGLPVGLLLEGMIGRDRELLAVAKAVETILAVSLRPTGI
jgi:mandelamide amidase